jgi:hypothetical protein
MSQQIVQTGRDDPAMDDESLDPVWVKIDKWLTANHQSWAWLGQQIGGLSPGRMGNWRRRGVPASQYSAVAAALDESTDWLLGLAEPKGVDPYRLSPMALRLAQEFDGIRDERQQLDAFAQIIALIARMRGI